MADLLQKNRAGGWIILINLFGRNSTGIMMYTKMMYTFFFFKSIDIVNEVPILLYDPCVHFSLEEGKTRKLMLGFWSVYIKTKSSISCSGKYCLYVLFFLCPDMLLNKIGINFKSVPNDLYQFSDNETCREFQGKNKMWMRLN